MQDILSRHNVSADEKVKLYNQVLQQYMNYKDQQQMAAQAPIRVTMVDNASEGKSTTVPAESSTMPDAIEREVLDSVPMRMKKKAQLLINRIKANPRLAWSDMGQLVYKDQVMANTNVADLVNDALRRRKHFEPHGWQIFAQAMKETNVPQDLIGHRERWQWMQRHPQEEVTAAAAAARQPTPQRKRKRVVSTRVPTRWSPY